MLENKPAPIEGSDDSMDLMGLIKEKYPNESPEVIAAAARVLIKKEAKEKAAFGEDDLKTAVERAKEVRAEGIPEVSRMVDSNFTVMGKDTDSEEERHAA